MGNPYLHTYRHTDIQTYRHTDIQTDIQIDMSVCIYVCLSVCMYVSVCLYVFKYGLMLRFLKNYLFDLDKLDIFEQYGSNYVGIASFQHYKTAGADVEAAPKIEKSHLLGLPLHPPIGGAM